MKAQMLSGGIALLFL